jgi:exopolysaccharide biosynthesis protein
MQWAAADENFVYGVINGGYFDMVKNESSSFICSNSHVYHKNGINTSPASKIFPTIGTFGVLQNGTFDIEWVYSFDDNLATYAFHKPNPCPGPEPMKGDGKYWNIKEGIGAGAILVKNRTVIQGNPEHFNVNNMVYTRHPRSGICYDGAGRLLLVAIDGRYSGSAGLTFEEFGILLQDLGCVDALNLDGGGSTLLYANNYILNHYSDSVPRPVVSAIVIRDKYKKKQNNLMAE